MDPGVAIARVLAVYETGSLHRMADRQREPGTGTSGEESTDPLAVVQMPSSCVIIDLAMSSMLRNLAFESRWMRRMFSTSALICSTAATAAP